MKRVVHVEFLQQGECLVARPRGRMEAAEAADFAATVQARLDAGTSAVTIDLEHVEFVSLAAIRAILRLARSLKGDGRSLDFVGGAEAVRHALEQAGLHELFAFTPALHPNRGTPR